MMGGSVIRTILLGSPRRSHSTVLDSPLTYTICAPLLTTLGAATTIIAPILLGPVEFGIFTLLLSIFQYVSAFDLGLSRLCDKLLTQPATNTPEVMDALLFARFAVGGTIGIIAVVTYPFAGVLVVLAALAGVAAMLSNGPIAMYRARSEIASFTVAGISTQFGMSLPRLGGLLVDGVRGSIIACAVWFGLMGLILHLPFVRSLRPVGWRRLINILSESTPLFMLSTAWLLYQLASRWFSWLISEPHEYGLFAFGANLVLIGLGVIGTVSQTYYPRHLVASDKNALRRELLLLATLAGLGCLVSIPVCHFALAQMFPNFAGAGPSASALLFSGIPLCLCAWLIPLVIARAQHPLRDAIVLFGSGLAALFVLMKLLDVVAGLDGQAWACTPPAMALLAAVLYLVVARQQLLTSNAAWNLLTGVAIIEACCAAGWYIEFH